MEPFVATGANWMTMSASWARNLKLDVREWAQEKLPTHFEDWRLLHVAPQLTLEFGPAARFDPVAAHPTWVYGQDSLELLVWMLQTHPGEKPEEYVVPHGSYAPISGQEHRVVLTGFSRITPKPVFRVLAELQKQYPDVIMHYEGAWVDKIAYGFRSYGFLVTRDPVPMACGLRARSAELLDGKYPQWVRAVGFDIDALQEEHGFEKFAISSLQFACVNWENTEAFRIRETRKDLDVDPLKVSGEWKTRALSKLSPQSRQGGYVGVNRRNALMRGDMIACDVCSLADRCRNFRVGSVCTLPNTTGSDLADKFGSANVDDIIEGLTSVVKITARRAEDALEGEDIAENGIDPEVSKVLDGLFNKGEKLAKLRDPKRFKAPAIVNNNNPVAIAGTPQSVQLQRGSGISTDDAITMLTTAGWSLDDVDESVIMAVMAGDPVPAPPPAVLEAVVLDG